MIANGINDMPFSEVLEIAEFGAGFELHLNAAVKGPPEAKKEEPKKDRFVIGKGNTGHPRLDPDGIPIKHLRNLLDIEDENAQQPQ